MLGLEYSSLALTALTLFSGVNAASYPVHKRNQEPSKPSCSSFTPFKYAGCFSDSGSTGTLLFDGPRTSNMTVETCVAFCKGNDYQYAGLEYYNECFCGSSVNGPQVNETFCNVPCDGDSSETCGANQYINIYQDPTFPTVSDTTIADYKPLGCYSEGTNGRSLAWRQNQLSTSNLTIEECLYACKLGGFSFAGLEYAQECYCGVVLGNGTAGVDSSECNKPCTGNSSEICGGSSTLNLYVAADLESTQPCNGGSPGSSAPVPPPYSTPASSASSQPPSTTSVTSSSSYSSSPPSTTSSSSSSVVPSSSSYSSPPSTTSCTTSTTSSSSSSSSSSAPPPYTSSTSSSVPPPYTSTSSSSSVISPPCTSSSSSSSVAPPPSTSISSSSSIVPPPYTSSSSSSSSIIPPPYTSSSSSVSSVAPPPSTSTTSSSSSVAPPPYTSSSTSTPPSTTSTTPSSTPCTTSSTSTTTSTPPPYTPPTTSTTSTKTTASLCTSTVTISPTPTCEYKCGNWCSSPIPFFSDWSSCWAAFTSCELQLTSCILEAGFPASLECVEFSSWCTSLSSYCDSFCPGNFCSPDDCLSKYPPSGPPKPSATISTSVYTCPPQTTAKPPSTTSSIPSATSCVPVPTNSNVCTQPNNPGYGYSSNSPVGGIALPCLTCNNLESDYNAGHPFKLYTSSDTTRCPSYQRNGSDGPSQGCQDACDTQYQGCINTYAQSCKNNWLGIWGDSYSSATTKCNNQHNDCYNVNSGVTGSGRCGGWNTGWW